MDSEPPGWKPTVDTSMPYIPIDSVLMVIESPDRTNDIVVKLSPLEAIELVRDLLEAVRHTTLR